MGVVYLATGNREHVAVKTIHPQLLDEPGLRERFQREANAVRSVHSPRVAQLLDANLGNDPAYLVFTYVPGPTLSARVLDGGPFHGQELIGLAAALADALAAIHGAGVTHRDIKPTNIICTTRGPVVIDFGVALIAEATTSLTATGLAVGSPGWMSPEQIEGHDVGPASDMFLWAATVAFAGSGRAPFGTGRADAIAYRILHSEPTIPDLPGPFGELVGTALAKNPAARPTADEVRTQLLGSDDGRSGTAEDEVTALVARTWIAPSPGLGVVDTARRRTRRRWLLSAAATIAGVAAIAAFIMISDHDPRTNWPDNGEDVATGADRPAESAGSTTTQPPATTAASSTTTAVTVPGPPGPPVAEWAGPAVPPPPDLRPAIDVLYGDDRQTGPFGCPLYAPTDMASNGWAPADFPQYTRIGTFEFGWESPTGATAYVDIHEPDSLNVQYYFDADPDGLVYDDGSILRTGDSTADELLITIPGSPCYYEISMIDVPMADRPTVLALRRIQLP
jgi:serine/threonine protein kinase